MFISKLVSIIILAGIVSLSLALGHLDTSGAVSVNQPDKRGMNLPDRIVARCHDGSESGPAPPVEDCKVAIEHFKAMTEDITVKLVEGCNFFTSGNCTGSVCPHRLGESTVSPTVAAKYMEDPVLNKCIAEGHRGYWIDGHNLGIGVYLT